MLHEAREGGQWQMPPDRSSGDPNPAV